MLFLVGSVLFSSYLTLALKAASKYGINLFQAIVFNYLTCVVTGSLVNGAFPINKQAIDNEWFYWALLMGVMFITLFNMIGITAQKNGVAVATVANKLSLIIPVVLAVYLYQESVLGWRLVGVVLALISVVFTSYQSPKADSSSPSQQANYLLPLALFLGSGLLDSTINHVQKNFVTENNQNAYLITGFFSAGMIGLLILVFQLIRGKQLFSYKNLLAGVLIGIPNYFSIWCLMKFLKESPWQSNASIPVNNMGIVLFSSVMAWMIFKEKLSKLNWVGILLSLIAIYFIAFGNSL